MKQYDTYKPSGIEWLGDIPEHWEVKRVKDSVVSPLKYGANEAAEDDNPLNPRYIRITDFSDNGLLKEETFKSLPHSIAKDYLLNEDDILFARSGATVGKTFIFKNYNGKACFAGYLIKVSLNKKIMTPSFLYFFSKSYSYDNWKNFINTESTIQNISAEKYNNLLLPFPPLSEQTAIANYLDTKTAAIDRKIELLAAKADKYKALRRSLINETVCRGLNPNAPLKDSGIEWIGKIPEHWEVKRFKSIANTVKGRNLELSDTYFENSLPNLSLEYLRNESVTFDTYCYTPDKNQRVTTDDMIIIWDGAGVGEILKGKEGFLSSTIAKIVVDKKKYNSKFLYHLRFSIEYILKMIPAGMGIPHLNPQVLNSFNCPCPPIDEQTEIAEYLNEKTTHIDTILANINEQINKLTQLRKTLINDVVTGKIKVTD